MRTLVYYDKAVLIFLLSLLCICIFLRFSMVIAGRTGYKETPALDDLNALFIPYATCGKSIMSLSEEIQMESSSFSNAYLNEINDNEDAQTAGLLTKDTQKFFSKGKTKQFIQSTDIPAVWEIASPLFYTRDYDADPVPIVHGDGPGGEVGDCLFVSVRTALLNDPNGHMKHVTIEALRLLVAAHVVGLNIPAGYINKALELKSKPEIDEVFDELYENGWDNEEFNQRLNTLETLESLGWQDQWSPQNIKLGNKYKTQSGEHFIVDTPQLQAKAVMFELSRMGGTHWGTEMDISALSKVLKIGIIILRHSTGLIYPYSQSAGEKPTKYILIYYLEGRHYQTAAIVDWENVEKNLNGEVRVKDSGHIKTVFTEDELPKFIKNMQTYCIPESG